MRLAIFLTLILFSSCTRSKSEKAKLIPSRVDSIDSAVELGAFVNAADTNLQNYEVRRFTDMPKVYVSENDSILENYATVNHLGRPFYRIDFDNNGYSDLLLHGGWNTSVVGDTASYHKQTLVLMNFGSSNIKVHNLNKDWITPVLAEPASFDGYPGIKVHFPFRKSLLRKDPLQIRHASLIYKFGSFVDYQPERAKNETPSISKIEYAAGPCFGTCPVYQLIIGQDRKAYFIAEDYNFDKDNSHEKDEGIFETQLKQKDYERLAGLLSYLAAQNLEDGYAVSHTCASTSFLRITYNNGKVKKIRDYGKAGTYGLVALYKMFDELRFNQEWKRINEPKGIRINWW